MTLSATDRDDLRRAKALLEGTSLAVRLTDALGKPIEMGVARLPPRVAENIHGIVQGALERALGVALVTIGPGGNDRPSSDRLHKLAAVTAGAVGGFFGLAGLAVELPTTTVIMLRSIGDIARSEGFDPTLAETRLGCLEVFALGGPTLDDDASETGYYAIRAALAKLVSDAVSHVAKHGLSQRGAPVLVRFLERVAVRFGIVVQEKVALELVPLVGAFSGAAINAIFTDHFQCVARGHFIVKRLERAHGMDAVRREYERS